MLLVLLCAVPTDTSVVSAKHHLTTSQTISRRAHSTLEAIPSVVHYLSNGSSCTLCVLQRVRQCDSFLVLQYVGCRRVITWLQSRELFKAAVAALRWVLWCYGVYHKVLIPSTWSVEMFSCIFYSRRMDKQYVTPPLNIFTVHLL
jgi:hypothetical protein